MAFAVNNGSWRTAKVVSVNNGSWRTAKGVWTHDGTAWRAAWMLNSAVTVAFSNNVYGYDSQFGIGSATPAVDVGGRNFVRIYYSLDSSKTFFRISGSGLSYTKTSYCKDIYLVGGSPVAFADALSFSGDSTEATWDWNGDVLGLAAANGTTVQLQARSA